MTYVSTVCLCYYEVFTISASVVIVVVVIVFVIQL